MSMGSDTDFPVPRDYRQHFDPREGLTDDRDYCIDDDPYYKAANWSRPGWQERLAKLKESRK